MNSAKQTFPSTLRLLWETHTFNPVAELLTGIIWSIFHGWPILPALFAKAFFDLLQGGRDTHLSLTGIIVLMLAASAVRCLLVFGSTGVNWFAGFGITALLQRNVLSGVFKQPGASALPNGVGEAISTLRDDVKAMTGSGVVFDSIGFAVFAGGSLIMLLSVNAWLTVLIFAPIMALIGLTHFMRTRLQYVRERSRAATADVTAFIGDAFAATQSVQIAGAVHPIVQHLYQLGEARRKMALRDRLAESGITALFDGTASLGAGLTLLAAAAAMRAGTFSLGDFALFASYLTQVGWSTVFLSFIVSTYQQLSVAFKRGTALMRPHQPIEIVAHHPIYVRGALPEIPQRRLSTDDRLDTLDVHGATVRFGNGDAGIHDISFSLKRGTFTVITGKVGAGKSTLLRAVLGLLNLDAGEIFWNKQRVTQPADFFCPPLCAYTPQIPTLLSGTLRENLLLGMDIDDAALNSAVSNAMLTKDVSRLADGLDSLIGVRGMKLSGGQVQRAAAARMLARAPELLVFDDLSSALDIETELALWDRVLALGATCLVVSHRPALLARAHQVLVLDNGRLVQRLTPGNGSIKASQRYTG
jgi:ATP-binding cassette subfamily B protein